MYALVVLAPLLGGSSSLQTLSGLVALILATVALALVATRAAGTQMSFPAFALGLLVCALFTAAQATSLPVEWLAWISPRAYDIRQFVLPEAARGAISYEVGASWREVTKFLLYAGVFVVAFHRGRGRRGLRRVTSSVLVAGLAVFVTGLIHRALGTERIFGVVDTLVPMSQGYTTFSNPNHSAGFLSLAGFCGLGLLLEARSNVERRVFAVGAGICLLGSIAAFSRAGMAATALSGLLLLALLSRMSDRRSGSKPGTAWAGAAVLAAFGLMVGLLVRAPEVAREVEGAQSGRVLGLAEKLAAMQDALAMSREHALVGIGRGAYASLYTLYKTSPLQLTFAFPENIVVQLVSEWGLPFGLLALLALLWALGRRIWKSSSHLALAAMIGIFGLVVHNLLDFSLELPGVAVPVVAVLGAASSRIMTAPRRRSPNFARQVLAVGAWAGLLVLALFSSFSHGELFRDLRSVSALVSSAEGQRVASIPRPESSRLELLQSQHPANALLVVQLAYAAEVADPPQLEKALTLANRAMYLAPTYAEGYFIGGRVLSKLGHRDQGLGLLRTAWALSAAPAGIVEQVLYYGRTATEVGRAIPRTDELGRLYSVPALRRAVHALRSAGRRTQATELLASVTPVQRYRTDDLMLLAQLAIEIREAELAHRFLGPLVSGEAKDPRALVLEARVLELEKRYEELGPKLEALSRAGQVSAEEVLAIRFRASVSRGDFATARATLEQLRKAAPPTYASRAELALMEGRLDLAEGRPAKALTVLSSALEVMPEDDRLRLLRAQVLADLGRRPEAIRDLQLVLRHRPRHAGAKRALERLDPAKERSVESRGAP